MTAVPSPHQTFDLDQARTTRARSCHATYGRKSGCIPTGEKQGAQMAKRSDFDRAEKTIATEEPARAEEAQRVIQEYIDDLREILKKLRKLFG